MSPWLMAGSPAVGNVRAKKETGRLYLDFMYQGVRCREFTSLPDTAANRRRVQALMEKIDREIALGKFNFRETFPGSPRADRFKVVENAPNTGIGTAKGQADHTPRFRAFAETWIDENRPAWRLSYEETVIGTLNQYLLPLVSG